MALILVGIDEAGYGPLLGPLCVGMAALRVEGWSPGDAAPDLWSRLAACVCRKPGDRRSRIAIDDSKKLKLPNLSDGAPGRHPLTHLERGIHAGLRCLGRRPLTDADLVGSLGASVEPHAWYQVDPVPAPASSSPEAMDIAGNVLAGGLAGAGVSIIDLACCVVGEQAFNDAVRRERTKAAANAIGVGAHLREAWERFGSAQGDAVRVVCDRQGGRTDYEDFLGALVPGAAVTGVERRQDRARYDLTGPGRAMAVHFQVEAERACLPVALASMAAKLVRETLMARFNRYWCARLPALRPTAGYALDARRWLTDARPVLTGAQRETLIRIA